MPVYIAAEPFLTADQVREFAPCLECIPEDVEDEVIEGWIDQASDMFASVSGMRVAGRYSLIARPCRDGMRCGCDCCHLDSIPLGDSKPTITLVTIDGETVDPEEYDLHWTLNGWNLVRIGDGITYPQSWPSYQELWKRDDTDGTFTIHLTVGVDIDQILIFDAIMELICDLATNNGQNMLQPGVVAANLGGTSISVDPDRLARLAAGEMGPFLSKALAIYAPEGRHTSAVYAPELADGWSLHLKVDATP